MFLLWRQAFLQSARRLEDIYLSGIPSVVQVCSATKKAGGTARKQGKNRKGKRRGIKANEGCHVKSGAVLVKQLGFRFHPGKNVGYARDHTLYALCEGFVKITHELLKPEPFRLAWMKPDYVERKFINVIERPKPRRLICVNDHEHQQEIARKTDGEK